MTLLERIQDAGYQVLPHGESLRLIWQGKGDPDPSQVIPLLEELKTRKEEVLKVLRASTGGEEHPCPDDPYQEAYLRAANTIGSEWRQEKETFIMRHLPQLWERIKAIEKRIDEIWDGDLDLFRRVVGDYVALYQEGFTHYEWLMATLETFPGSKVVGPLPPSTGPNR